MQTLASLEKGHEFPPTAFELSAEWVGRYVVAVEDEAILTSGPAAVPPMAVAALSIRALLERAALPPGAIHVAQEIANHRAVGIGDRLSVAARVVSRGERAGWVLMGIDLSVMAGREDVMSGRAVVTFPVGAAS
jgi:acyl dehydratase